MPIFGEYKEITDERRDEMIAFLVSKVEKYGMFVPAIFFLETGQPLSFVFSQLVYGGAPFGEMVFKDGQNRMEDYAQIFEDRRNLTLLIDALQNRADEVRIEEEKEKLRKKREKEKLRLERQANGKDNKNKGKFRLPWSK